MAQKASDSKVKHRKRRSTIGIVAEVAAAYGVKLPPEQMEPSLTPNQIGEIMGLSGEAVKQWIYHRRLPAVKLANGYWQVRKADLERFLKARFEGARRKILAVGLDGETLRTLSEAVDSEKYESLATDLMADALLKINDLQPAMVLMDMSWKHSWELVEKIRAYKSVRGIPILILETPAEAADIERAAQLEIKGCLMKPVSAAALEQQISGIMNRYV